MIGQSFHPIIVFASAQLKCLNANGGTDVGQCDTGLPTASATGDQLHTFLQIALGLFAIIAVLMIIISALNIIYGEGDPQKVSRARSSIIYALVGLAVAVSAEVIVTYVTGRF